MTADQRAGGRPWTSIFGFAFPVCALRLSHRQHGNSPVLGDQANFEGEY